MSISGFQFARAIAILLAIGIVTDAMAQDRALIISLDSYRDPKLAGAPSGLAENDAAAIRKLLIEKLGYKPEQIKTLRNEQATKAAILSAIGTWLGPETADESGALESKKKAKTKRRAKKKKRKPRPKTFRSYLYFSGLGSVQPDSNANGKNGADKTLIPFDATVRAVAGEERISGMISGDELSQAIGKFIRRHTTLVFDTSHAAPPARGNSPDGDNILKFRSPRLNGFVAKNHAGGALVETSIKRGSLTLWSAASAGQSAIAAGADGAPLGLFTRLYVEGLKEGKADANGNGIISNAELLRHLRAGSSAYCEVHKQLCERGLRPRLAPPGAFGKAAWVNRKKVTRARERRLSVTRLADFLGAPSQSDIEIKQIPPPPLHVGATGIRFQVISPVSGYLVLLNLTQRGELFQLYPSPGPYAGDDKNSSGGPIKANVPLLVPDKSYGMQLSATVPGKGHIVAVFTPGPVPFHNSVTGRVISVVSANEAIPVYLARLAAALHAPLDTGSPRWSVVTLPYEILP